MEKKEGKRSNPSFHCIARKYVSCVCVWGGGHDEVSVYDDVYVYSAVVKAYHLYTN